MLSSYSITPKKLSQPQDFLSTKGAKVSIFVFVLLYLAAARSVPRYVLRMPFNKIPSVC